MYSVDERRWNDSVKLNYSDCRHRRRRCPYCRLIDETSLGVNEGYFSGFVVDSVAVVLHCLDWLVEECHCQVRTTEKRCRQYTRRSRSLCRSSATIVRWRTTDGTDRSCSPVWNRLFRSFVCVWIRRRRPVDVLWDIWMSLSSPRPSAMLSVVSRSSSDTTGCTRLRRVHRISLPIFCTVRATSYWHTSNREQALRRNELERDDWPTAESCTWSFHSKFQSIDLIFPVRWSFTFSRQAACGQTNVTLAQRSRWLSYSDGIRRSEQSHLIVKFSSISRCFAEGWNE